MIEKFLDYLRYERRSSENTIEHYGRDLNDFEAFFRGKDSQLSWETIDSDIIRDWMESMMDKGNTATTIKRRLSALRSFFRFALSRGLVGSDPAHAVEGPKKAKPLPQFVKEREMNQLLDELPWDNTYKEVRARTVILLFYTTGIRLSELIALDDADVSFINRELKVTGKRDKQRIIPFGDELAQALKAYMTLRDHDVERRSTALFLTQKGERMNRNRVQYEVRKHVSRVSSLKKRTPHVLRHSFATAMVNHDAGLENVKQLLGHESVSTTEIYTHTTFEQLKKAYHHAHPRA